MSDEERNLARSTRTVQNLGLMLLAGMIIGGIVGIVLAAYVIIPAMDSGAGYIVALVAIPVCAFLGQRIVLGLLTRG